MAKFKLIFQRVEEDEVFDSYKEAFKPWDVMKR